MSKLLNPKVVKVFNVAFAVLLAAHVAVLFYGWFGLGQSVRLKDLGGLAKSVMLFGLCHLLFVTASKRKA
jgi:hypothetical protein